MANLEKSGLVKEALGKIWWELRKNQV